MGDLIINQIFRWVDKICGAYLMNCAWHVIVSQI